MSDTDSQVIKRKGLGPAATHADGNNPPVVRTGAALMNAGIKVTLKGQFVSEWVFVN